MAVELKYSKVFRKFWCVRQIKSYVNNMFQGHILHYYLKLSRFQISRLWA